MILRDGGTKRWLGIALGASLMTAVGVSGAFAQEATPPANAEATPETGTSEATPAPYGGSAAEKTALAEMVQQVTDTIATVQADRDAAAGQTDVAAVDDLLAKAAARRDTAKTTLTSDDISTAHIDLMTAHQLAMAAEELLRAQLAAYGLPSQQAGASRVLVAAYNQIDEITGRNGASEDADVAALVTTAQTLYAKAYELYNAGTYVSAAGTAQVAAQVASLADLKTASFTIALPGQGAGFVEAGGYGPKDGKPGEATAGGDVHVVEGEASAAGGSVYVVDGEEKGRRGGGGMTDVPPGVVEIVPGGFVQGVPAAGANVVVLEPFGFGGGFHVDKLDDFSTESPLEVPAPDFSS